MFLVDGLRRFWNKQKPPKVWARCEHCGEDFLCRGYFDQKHYETIDGVACGRQGRVVRIEDEL